MDEKNDSPQPPRYTWPKYVLGLVILGFTLAIFWMSVLVIQTRERRDTVQWPKPAPQTNSPAAQSDASVVHTNSPALETNRPPAQTNALSATAQRMAEFSDTLSGGNAAAGRKVFFESPAASCSKCHKAEGQGGDNGPVLDGIITRHPREFILESILFPNVVINSNYQTVVVVLNNSTAVSGTLKSETESNLVLLTPEDGPVTVQKMDIKQRWIGASPMPEGIWQSLSKQDLRDLIEFVATLKNPPTLER
jgi:quinoprotein glucose dehydrogenase